MPNTIAKQPGHGGIRKPDLTQQRPWCRKLEQSRPVCLILVALSMMVFWPVRTFDYVNYDDADYVAANPHVQTGLSWPNLVWAFSSGHASNWHPLTWLSHQLDWQLFGSSPGPQHMVNLALHAVNAGLLFLVLRRITGAHWRSALVATFFALHPLRAESVAWISERKDVLSGFFLLLTVGAYGQYAQSRISSAPRPWRIACWYFLALVCFALGLMSKPMLVTVPFLLLLLDYWPLERLKFDSTEIGRGFWLVVEKLPFFVLAAASSVITFLVQRGGGAVSTSLSLGARAGNALVSYVRYLAKTVWPQDLSVLYPHPGHWPAWEVAGSGVLLVALSVGLLVQIRRRPYLTVGWLWFVGTLVPVIGLVQVGIQSMADRYTYIPCIGLFIVVVWGANEALQHRPKLRAAAGVFVGFLVVVCAFACAHQIQFWRDSRALFQRAIAVTSDNYLAYNNLGFYLSGKGKLEEAKENYRKSLGINPLYPDALNNLGFALAAEGKHAEAIAYYEAALRVSPNQPEIRNNLGNALAETGRAKEAVEQYVSVLRQQPDHAEAQNNLGIALAMQGKLDEAIEHFRAAIRAKPDYASAHSNLGNALAAQRKFAEATAEYQQSLRLNPADAQAHNNLGNAFIEQGRAEDAIQHYTEALRLKADNSEAHFNLAVALLKINRRNEAVAHLQQAVRLNPSSAAAKRQLQLLGE